MFVQLGHGQNNVHECTQVWKVGMNKKCELNAVGLVLCSFIFSSSISMLISKTCLIVSVIGLGVRFSHRISISFRMPRILQLGNNCLNKVSQKNCPHEDIELVERWVPCFPCPHMWEPSHST